MNYTQRTRVLPMKPVATHLQRARNYLLAEADMAGDAVGLGRGHLGLGEDDQGGPPRRRVRGRVGGREVVS
jgi:hypothetical protein